MKKQLSKKNLITAALLCMLYFNSCTRYETEKCDCNDSDEERITFGANIIGRWYLHEINNDAINDYDLIFIFERDGDFTLKGEYTHTYGSESYTYDFNEIGEWEWVEQGEVLEIDFEFGTEEYEVVTLTRDILELEDEVGDEYRFERTNN